MLEIKSPYYLLLQGLTAPQMFCCFSTHVSLKNYTYTDYTLYFIYLYLVKTSSQNVIKHDSIVLEKLQMKINPLDKVKNYDYYNNQINTVLQ